MTRFRAPLAPAFSKWLEHEYPKRIQRGFLRGNRGLTPMSLTNAFALMGGAVQNGGVALGNVSGANGITLEKGATHEIS